MASKPKLAKLKAPAKSAGAVRARAGALLPPVEAAAAGSIPAASIRKAAKLAPQEPKCSACEGQRDETGKWIHSARCPRTTFLYFGSGFRPGDWTSPIYQCCPYKCPGHQVGSGMTHSWDCPFWDGTDATPFDSEAFDDEPPF